MPTQARIILQTKGMFLLDAHGLNLFANDAGSFTVTFFKSEIDLPPTKIKSKQFDPDFFVTFTFLEMPGQVGMGE